jgi:hypothetical protein
MVDVQALETNVVSKMFSTLLSLKDESFKWLAVTNICSWKPTTAPSASVPVIRGVIN